jgi:hypothetical protein
MAASGIGRWLKRPEVAQKLKQLAAEKLRSCVSNGTKVFSIAGLDGRSSLSRRFRDFSAAKLKKTQAKTAPNILPFFGKTFAAFSAARSLTPVSWSAALSGRRSLARNTLFSSTRAAAVLTIMSWPSRTAKTMDAIRVRHGSPEAAVAEFSELCKSYGISTVTGDNYAKSWPQEAFRRYGILYLRCDQIRSDFYIAAARLIRSGRVELLDHPKMLLQFATLERKTSPFGRDTVNHPPGGHDDICNAVAGALVMASLTAPDLTFHVPFVAERPRGTTDRGLPPVICDPGSFENPLAPHRPEYQSGDLPATMWYPGMK